MAKKITKRTTPEQFFNYLVQTNKKRLKKKGGNQKQKKQRKSNRGGQKKPPKTKPRSKPKKRPKQIGGKNQIEKKRRESGEILYKLAPKNNIDKIRIEPLKPITNLEISSSKIITILNKINDNLNHISNLIDDFSGNDNNDDIDIVDDDDITDPDFSEDNDNPDDGNHHRQSDFGIVIDDDEEKGRGQNLFTADDSIKVGENWQLETFCPNTIQSLHDLANWNDGTYEATVE